MDFVHIDDVVGDDELREDMDPGLFAVLQQLGSQATAQSRDASGRFENTELTVSKHGEITVNPVDFEAWVYAAGELARHVGPAAGFVNGELRRVEDLLDASDDDEAEDADVRAAIGAGGVAVDAVASPPAAVGDSSPNDSGHYRPGLPALEFPEWTKQPLDADGFAPNVVAASIMTAYRCDSCGAASDAASDFTEASPSTCMCGATRAVRCDDCNALILIREP